MYMILIAIPWSLHKLFQQHDIVTERLPALRSGRLQLTLELLCIHRYPHPLPQGRQGVTGLFLIKQSFQSSYSLTDHNAILKNRCQIAITISITLVFIYKDT